MSSLKQFGRVIWAGIQLNLARLSRYRTSTLLDFLASALHITAYVLFWEVVFTKVGILPGWSFGEILIYLGYSELFFALGASFFGSATKMGNVINRGQLDVYLIRPVDPRLLIFAGTFRVEYLIRAIPGISLLFGYGWFRSDSLSISNFLLGCIIVFFAAWALALIQSAGSFLSFWLGWSRAVEEVTESLTYLTRYPATIFSPQLRFLITFLLPVGIAATEPALLASKNTSVWLVVISTFSVFLGWYVISEVTWRKGLSQYESYGG